MLLTHKNKEGILADAKAMSTHLVEQMKSEVLNESDARQKAAMDAFEARVQELFQKALEADRAKRYDSTEPFVEIISETFSEEGGVQLRLDWNAPFVNYLKRNGFTGPTDESIVDNWLISLSRERIAEGGSEFK